MSLRFRIQGLGVQDFRFRIEGLSPPMLPIEPPMIIPVFADQLLLKSK